MWSAARSVILIWIALEARCWTGRRMQWKEKGAQWSLTEIEIVGQVAQYRDFFAHGRSWIRASIGEGV